MYNLSECLHKFIQKPFNPTLNFNLGLAYEILGQTASASSFYLRAAEKTLDKNLQYCALIRNALCFEKQGRRDLTVKTLLQRAIALLPDRPEGYFFLSRLQERKQDFHDSYCTASIGLTKNTEPDLLLPEYMGSSIMLFQKGISAWWVGLTEDSRDIMFDLHFNHNLPENYRTLVNNNLQNLGYPKRKFVYSNSYQEFIKYPFPGLETIKNNYSQVFQDMFVLSVLGGKRKGTYLEIGASDPFYNNNTALLEQFDWTGISIEILPEEVEKFKHSRKNTIIKTDGRIVDYKLLLERQFPDVIDYLQVDCDPASVSFEILKKICSVGKRFRVIHFEHDAYVDESFREPSRHFLKQLGYELRVPNVAFNEYNAFEDWWVDAQEVNNNFKECINNSINFAPRIIYNTE